MRRIAESSQDMSGSYSDTGRTKQMKDVLGVRHIQAVLLGGALFVNHVQQGNIGISAVAMTSKQYKTYETFHWTQDEVRMSKGSYFYSLMVSSLIAGYLTTKYDIKTMLLGSTVIGTLLNYLTPTLIRNYGWNAFFYIRLVQGAAKGFISPLVYAQLVRWLPPDELMLIGPVVLSSIYLGIGIILMMGGYLSTGQGCWPSIFYFSGNIGFIWCLAYIGLGSQSPNTCFYISVNEKRYIEESLPAAIRLPYREHIPWKKILSCVPLYALMIAHSANNYAIQSFIKIIPLFFQHSLGVDVKRVGLVMGLPFLGASFLIYFKYPLIKFLIKRKILNYSEVRHISNGIGSIKMALSECSIETALQTLETISEWRILRTDLKTDLLIAINNIRQFGAFYFFMYCAFSENYSLSFALHCIGMVLCSFQINGFYMNYFDLSPNFVGLIVGFDLSCAHLFSIVGPLVSFDLYKYYYEDPSGPKSAVRAKEAIYFFIAMFFFLSGLLWELLGSTKIQPFNDIKENEESEEKFFNESDIIKT